MSNVDDCREWAAGHRQIIELGKITALCDEYDALVKCVAREVDDIEQTLGRALGYPRYCDDQKNFPGATNENGVCVGEHVPASLAAEAAERIRALEERVAKLDRIVQWFYNLAWYNGCSHIADPEERKRHRYFNLEINLNAPDGDNIEAAVNRQIEEEEKEAHENLGP